MLLHNGLVKVLWVKAYIEGTIRLVEVHQGRHPLSRWTDIGHVSLGDHVIKGLLYLVSVLYGHFPTGMLNRGNGRVSPDGIGTWHVAYGVN